MSFSELDMLHLLGSFIIATVMTKVQHTIAAY